LSRRRPTGINLSLDEMVIQRIHEAAEKAEIELSSTTQTEINPPFITADASGPKRISMKIMRPWSEGLINPLAERTVKLCESLHVHAQVAQVLFC
jgi:molecular chaperone DnaK